MKYFIVFDFEYGYEDISNVTGFLYSAESREELFKFIYGGRDMNYKITAADIEKPKREAYKSDRSFHQAYNAYLAMLPERLGMKEAEWKNTVYMFKMYTVELNIPCQETEMRKIQEFSV